MFNVRFGWFSVFFICFGFCLLELLINFGNGILVIVKLSILIKIVIFKYGNIKLFVIVLILVWLSFLFIKFLKLLSISVVNMIGVIIFVFLFNIFIILMWVVVDFFGLIFMMYGLIVVCSNVCLVFIISCVNKNSVNICVFVVGINSKLVIIMVVIFSVILFL